MKNALTLPEVLIIMAIILIIASIAIPNLVAAKEEAEAAAAAAKNTIVTEPNGTIHEISTMDLTDNNYTGRLYMRIITLDGVEYLVVSNSSGLGITPLIPASDSGAYSE